MLRRLFKSRNALNDPDPAVRRAAVAELGDEEAQGLAGDLARLLAEDPSPDVRLACLERISDVRLVTPLLDDPRLAAAAARRLAALGGSADPGVNPGTGSERLLAEVTELTEPQAAARIGTIDDLDTLLELALKVRGTVREAVLAHPLLGSAGALSALEKRSRHHDKALNRHARRELDRRRKLQHQADAARARAEELSAALERPETVHNERAWRERQHELHRRLEEALNGHAELRAALAAFGEELPDLGHLRRDPAELLPREETAPVVAPEPATAAEDDPFAALVAEFRDLDRRLEAGEAFDAIAAQRQALTERWLTTADHRPPAESQHEVFEFVSHRFREVADAVERLAAGGVPPLPEQPLDALTPGAGYWKEVESRRSLLRRLTRLRRQLNWPEWARPAPELVRLLEAEAALTGELERADARLTAEVAALEEQVQALARAIDEGHLNEARGLLGKARSHKDALPAQATRNLDTGLGKQAARLAELKDWQTFATTPKREALLASMTALAERPLAPPEQAERIKALRRDWQALGPVTQAVDGRLADRFNAEAEKAFEPCRSHFAELAARRKANLAERERICEQLEVYLAETDWAHADMKAAERIMRAARDEWRIFHPVDRNPGKAVERRFEKLQGRLHDRVKAEWDRNLGLKEALVAEAEALLQADGPVHEKTSAAKSLQHRWREVGITPRRPDQRLWRDFRKACDGIFAARDDARHAAHAAVDEQARRLEEALDEFEAALNDQHSGDAPAIALRELRQRTADLDALPVARRRRLAERRAALEDRYRQVLTEQRRRAARARLADLARWDAMVSEAEARGKPAPQAPDDVDPAIARGRLQAGGTSVDVDALRRLAVRAELAAGLESPAEDEKLRLEVQVQRLQAGMTGGGTAEGPEELAEAWCRVGPKGEDAAPLRERFFRALDTLL